MTTELSREMVRAAPQITNAIEQRELSLRGLHLAQLPVTDGQLWLDILSNFDALDLSENVLQWLDAPTLPSSSSSSSGAPKQFQEGKSESKAAASSSSTVSRPIRLTSILLHKNRLRGISRTFASQLSGSLTSIVLHDNVISTLNDCNVFGLFQKLERLSLCGNPVRDHPDYRKHVIGVCGPSLKLLDFTKVRDAERTEAAEYNERWRRQQEAEEEEKRIQQQQQQQDGGGTAVLGAGKRAARKAAALAAAGGGSDAGGKRERGAASAAAGVAGIEDKVAAATRSKAGPQDESTNAVNRDARRRELEAALEAAETVEEMDRIEEELKALGF